MAGVGLPKTVFMYYRQVKIGTLVIGLVGLAVTMGNMFVPKPAVLDNPETLTPKAPATSQQSPWDQHLSSTPTRQTTPQRTPQNPQGGPFAGNGSGGPFAGGGDGGPLSGGGDGGPFAGGGDGGPFGSN